MAEAFRVPPPARIVVDAMNVLGSTPDGWWRDRDGAARRLLDRLEAFAESEGIPVTAVLDGRPLPGRPEGEAGRLEVLYARRRGRNAADDRLVEYVRSLPEPEGVLVVTSDRDLVSRVLAAGARTIGARVFLGRVQSSG